MNKEQLVIELVNRGYNSNDLDGLPEETLKEMLIEEVGEVEFENVEVDFDDEEVQEDNFEVIDTDDLVVPAYTDPGWNDYVLAQFTDDELYEGNPTVDGLRRVVEKIIGEVMDTDTNIVQVPMADNDNRATAVVKVTILKHPEEDGKGEKIVCYSGSADACGSNLQDTVRNYPVAMAETRAEGRALRRALRLRNVAAEELSSGVFQKPRSSEPSLAEETVAEESAIKPHQTTMVKTIAKRLNINVEKLIEKLVKSEEMAYNKDSGLTEANGAKLNKTLSAYQSAAVDIPEEIIGFDSNWGDS